MEVIALTTLFSILFAVFFLLLFLRSRESRAGSIEQDSLLPFTSDFDVQLGEPEHPIRSDYSSAVFEKCDQSKDTDNDTTGSCSDKCDDCSGSRTNHDRVR